MSQDPQDDGTYGAAVRAALRAEAEEARTGLRAEGIVCPSCGINAAGLSGTGHELKFSEGDLPATVAAGGTVRCADGQPVDLRKHLVEETTVRFGRIQALACVDLLDAWERNWAKVAAGQIIGPPRTEPFEGFLSVLRQEAVIEDPVISCYWPVDGAGEA